MTGVHRAEGISIFQGVFDSVVLSSSSKSVATFDTFGLAG